MKISEQIEIIGKLLAITKDLNKQFENDYLHEQEDAEELLDFLKEKQEGKELELEQPMDKIFEEE